MRLKIQTFSGHNLIIRGSSYLTQSSTPTEAKWAKIAALIHSNIFNSLEMFVCLFL